MYIKIINTTQMFSSIKHFQVANRTQDIGNSINKQN